MTSRRRRPIPPRRNTGGLSSVAPRCDRVARPARIVPCARPRRHEAAPSESMVHACERVRLPRVRGCRLVGRRDPGRCHRRRRESPVREALGSSVSDRARTRRRALACGDRAHRLAVAGGPVTLGGPDCVGGRRLCGRAHGPRLLSRALPLASDLIPARQSKPFSPRAGKTRFRSPPVKGVPPTSSS
jgi:hypothetical protein